MIRVQLRLAAAVAVVAVVALTPTAAATTPGTSWAMDLNGAVVNDATGYEPMTLIGPGIRSATGRTGGAVEFTQAPSIGMVAGSKADNPGTQNFALGIVFTTQPIPTGNYTGNLMQKGLFGDPGQVKLQLVPAAHGTVNCRIKGTSGARIITSTVTVDDGGWHTAACWRNGSVVGVTVDGVVTSSNWNPGSVTNQRSLTLANKGTNADASDQHFGRTDFATWVIAPNARAIVEQQIAAPG